jgi:hypothetical protein
MCLQGVLLGGMPGFVVLVIGEAGYEILVLLEACSTLRLTGICCDFDDVLPPVASLSGVGL